MLKLKEFKANFHHHEVPEELAKVLEFQNSVGVPFSRGFKLAVHDRSGLVPISGKREFLDAICPLGPANGSGAFYALWAREAGKDVRDRPVLAFGEEGGVHVVAEEVRQFLRILTLDGEPMIDEESLLFVTDPTPSPGARNYASWLEKHLHLKAVKDLAEVELMLRSTRVMLEAPLQKWLKHFADDAAGHPPSNAPAKSRR